MSPLVVEQERERKRKRKLERKLKLSGGTFVRGGLCPFPPSSMRIRTVWAFCAQYRSVTDIQTKKQANSAS